MTTLPILDDGGAPTFARFVAELEAQGPLDVAVLTPDLEAARPEDLEAAQLGWAWRVVDEYRSALRFTELLRDLLVAEAPFSALSSVHRLVGDELRHARLCARAAAAFGSLEGLRIELDGLGWKGPPRPPKERALEIVVRELVIGEGESIAAMRSYRHVTTDPAMARVLDVLLEDEVRHFATGRHLETLLLERWPELAALSAELEPVLLEDVRTIRAQHRHDARGGPGRRYGVSIRLEEAPPAVPVPGAPGPRSPGA